MARQHTSEIGKISNWDAQVNAATLALDEAIQEAQALLTALGGDASSPAAAFHAEHYANGTHKTSLGRADYIAETDTVAMVSASSFTVAGDHSAVAAPGDVNGQAVRLNDTENGYVTDASYAAGTDLTTVTIQGATVPDPLNKVEWGPDPRSFAAVLAGREVPIAESTDEGKSLVVDSVGNFSLVTVERGASVTVDIAGSSDTTLTAVQYENRVVKLSGAVSAAKSIIFPATAGDWTLDLAGVAGDYELTFKPSGGSGVTWQLGGPTVVQVVSDGATMQMLTRMQVEKAEVSIAGGTAAGDFSVTGLSFRPQAVDVYAYVSGAASYSFGHGAPDGGDFCMWMDYSGTTMQQSFGVAKLGTTGAIIECDLTSWGDDGATFTEVFSGSPAFARNYIMMFWG